MKTFQRILAIALALIMSLSVLGTVAFAASTTFESGKTTGSLTIHKLEKGESAANPVDSTGRPLDKLPDGYTALGEVTFTVYQVLTQAQFESYLANTLKKTVDGEEQIVTELNVTDFYNATTKAVTNFSGGNVAGESKSTPSTTDASKNEVAGQVVFSDLSLGVYLVVESSYPAKVTEPMTPFLVSIPMTDPANENEWLYDVTVYPKNDTSEGTVKVTKTDASGTGLDNVTFELKKGITNGDTTTYPESGTTYTTADGGKLSDLTLTPGKYSLAEVSAPAGYIVDKRPIYFEVTADNTIVYDTKDLDPRTQGEKPILTLSGSNEKTLTITLKNEKPDVNKTLADGKKEGTVGIGDTVSYKVTVDVPSNITDLQTFTLTDTPTNLNVTNNTIAIKYIDANNTEQTLITSAYSVSEDDKDGTIVNGFTITFTPSQMSAVAGKQIVVTYNAVVLEGAADDVAAPNTVNLTYSDSIVTTGTPGNWQIEDGAVVYTYKLGVIKYKDAVGESNKMEGVEFSLYTSETGGDALSVVKEKTGIYRKAIATDSATDTTTTLVTAADGTIVVKGLDNGTYYLEETKTASGYNLLQGRVEVKLAISTKTSWNSTKTYENSLLTKQTYGSATHTNDDDNIDALKQTTIINKKGFDLPQTGGIGTLMFIIIGGVLIAGGICLIAVPNKKRSV